MSEQEPSAEEVINYVFGEPSASTLTPEMVKLFPYCESSVETVFNHRTPRVDNPESTTVNIDCSLCAFHSASINLQNPDGISVRDMSVKSYDATRQFLKQYCGKKQILIDQSEEADPDNPRFFPV